MLWKQAFQLIFNIMRRVTQRLSLSLSLFRVHFEKMKKIPVLQLDASVEFQSDSEVREQFISKVCSFISRRHNSCHAGDDHMRALSSCLTPHLLSSQSQSQTCFLFLIWCLMCLWFIAILKKLLIRRWRTSSMLCRRISSGKQMKPKRPQSSKCLKWQKTTYMSHSYCGWNTQALSRQDHAAWNTQFCLFYSVGF